MKRIFKTAGAFLLLAALAAGAQSCGEDKYILVENRLRLDSDSYTFGAEGEDVWTVAVESHPSGWDVRIAAEWIQECGRTESSVSFRAEPNPESSERRGEIEVFAGSRTEKLLVRQLPAAGGELPQFRMFPELLTSYNGVMSANGRFVSGYEYEMVDNGDYTYSYLYTPLIIDLETGELHRLETVDDMLINIRAVSDDGKTLLINDIFRWIGLLTADNVFTELPCPDGMAVNDCYVEDFSADARIVYGYGRKTSDPQGPYYPVRWTDGIPEILPLPADNGRGGPVAGGFRAQRCSADGTKVYGTERDSWAVAVWTTGSGAPAYAGAEHYRAVEGMIDMSDWGFGMVETTLYNQCEADFAEDCYRISPNGRYVALRYYSGDIVDYWYDDRYYPALYDTHSGTATVFRELENMSALTVSDDGVLFMKTDVPRAGTDTTDADRQGMVYDPSTGTLSTCSQWVMQRYGITVPENIHIVRAGSDGNILARTFLDNNGTPTTVLCAIVP